MIEITHLEWKWREKQVLAWDGYQLILTQSIKASGYARKLRDRLACLGYCSKDIRTFVNGEPVSEKIAAELIDSDTMDAPDSTKTAHRQRFEACALANTPANVRVIEIRKDLSGRAACVPGKPGFGKLMAPRPVTRKSLYIFLHECAHFALHADGKRRKVYVLEMEAEKWAHARMREAGIPVPRSMTLRAKSYVRRKMKTSVRRGSRLDPTALKYIGGKQVK